jgi:hypothetical protein
MPRMLWQVEAGYAQGSWERISNVWKMLKSASTRIWDK